MKRFLSTVAFCAALLVFGLFVLLPKTTAEKNLVQNLLNLPAPPPPNPLMAGSRRNYKAEFFSKSNPPNDDAPVEDTLAYWQAQNNLYSRLGYNIKPSDTALNKIRAEIEKNPALVLNFLNILPENAETTDLVKRVYESQSGEEDSDEGLKERTRDWLLYHSNYFSDELAQAAEQVGDAGGYVSNQETLLSLARVDWDKAQPILNRLLNDSSQPVSQVLARWAFYRHALDTDSLGDTERFRDELKRVVEDKSATAGMRDLAFDALVREKDWSGRDDWYMTLLGDETLADLRINGQSYTGLTTIVMYSDPEKYADKMLKLLDSGNQAERNAAVRNLALVISDKNPEVIRALLPWLEDAKWAKETSGERRILIAVLRTLKMPEAVPGLIEVLNEKQTREYSVSTLGNSSMMNSTGNSNMMRMSANSAASSNSVGAARIEEYYPYRWEAVAALTTQRDARAAGALRALLPQVQNWEAGTLVQALIASRGFTVGEEVAALESIAKNYSQDELVYPDKMISNSVMMNTVVREVPPPPPPPLPISNMMVNSSEMANGDYVVRQFNPANIKPILATQLVNTPEPDEELVQALVARIGILDAKDTATAQGLRQIMKNWHGAAINALLLQDLKIDKADADSIVKLLSLRKELRENQSNLVFDARNGTPTALGIAACILEDDTNYDTILQGENIEAKTAMLACARLIRAPLPIQKVAANLRNSNAALALAAERYLEAEDSPEARQIVLSLHPNEAKILGARTVFAGGVITTGSRFLPALFASVDDSITADNYYLLYVNSDSIEATEKNLQKEIRENQELLGVYSYDDNFIRIYKDKAVFSWQEDKARYRERTLSKEEFDAFKTYLAAENVNALPPFLSNCDECKEKQLTMLSRQGGRRVFVKADPAPKFFSELDSIFVEMRRPPAKLHYRLEKSVAGLEILFEDNALQAETLWKNAGDFRLLINDEAKREQIDKELQKQEEEAENNLESEEEYEKFAEAQRKRRLDKEYENFAWYKFAGNKLSGLIEQPAQVGFMPKSDGLAIRADQQQWKAATAAFEIRADSEGLYKISGGRTTKIVNGNYEKPIVTADGRWAIAVKEVEEYGRNLVRVNLLTNKEFVVKFGDYPSIELVAFVAPLNKVLLFASGYVDYETDRETAEKFGKYFLLDPATGNVQEATGELRPLAQQTFRPLQTTGKPDEFWAAIPNTEKDETQIGVYNIKTFTFKSLMKIPQITFDSMAMWVDADKIYFVYQGHLLALPLGKTENRPAANNTN